MRHFITTIAVSAITSSALAVTIPLGTFTVDDDPTTGDIPVTIPAGTYNHYSFSTEWSPVSGDPWSIEAIWALTDGPISDPNTTFYAGPGPSDDAEIDSDPVTLNWDGFLLQPLSNPPTTAATFLSVQDFAGTVAQWANTTLTLDFVPPVIPPFTLVGIPSTNTFTVNADDTFWLALDYVSGPLTIDTLGSSLIGDGFGDVDDTTIGLFNSDGFLVGFNDDIDAFNLLSMLSFADGDLTPGRYYLAASYFAADIGPLFQASSDQTFTGTYIINIDGNVPEPASLGMLCLGGVMLRRRRS